MQSIGHEQDRWDVMIGILYQIIIYNAKRVQLLFAPPIYISLHLHTFASIADRL